jgi:hypothetical protein
MPARSDRDDRPDARTDMRPFPHEARPENPAHGHPSVVPASHRIGLRVSERCLIRFNGVSGIKETVEHTGRVNAENERLGEVSEPLS